MKNRILIWVIGTLKDFRKALIAFAVASGIGALIYAFAIKIGIQTYKLIKNHLSELGTLTLFALFYFLGKQIEKSKNKKKHVAVSVIQQELIQIGNLKWDITLYSDNNFTVEPVPYCAAHNMRLVEQWPLYFCPRHNECNTSISKRELPIALATVESHIDSQLRKMNK